MEIILLIYLTSVGLPSIAYSSPSSTDYFGLKQIYVDGVRLLDADALKLSVVSADAANSQMVVDGGKWNGGGYNESKIWRKMLPSEITLAASVNGLSNSFDGDLDTAAQDNSSEVDATSGKVYWNPVED